MSRLNFQFCRPLTLSREVRARLVSAWRDSAFLSANLPGKNHSYGCSRHSPMMSEAFRSVPFRWQFSGRFYSDAQPLRCSLPPPYRLSENLPGKTSFLVTGITAGQAQLPTLGK